MISAQDDQVLTALLLAGVRNSRVPKLERLTMMAHRLTVARHLPVTREMLPHPHLKAFRPTCQPTIVLLWAIISLLTTELVTLTNTDSQQRA